MTTGTRRRRVSIAAGLTALVALSAPTAFSAGPTTQSDDGSPTPRAVRINGTPNAEMWQTAPPISNFVQREPHEGAPPTQRTEFRVAYDATTIYVRVNAFDTEPEK